MFDYFANPTRFVKIADVLFWPLVIAARMNEGECPLSVGSDAALMEERRLAYVAMSRAKERLVLTHVTLEAGGAFDLARQASQRLARCDRPDPPVLLIGLLGEVRSLLGKAMQKKL